ncbi:g5007 [Coccomyxa viridis]|uniref:G5007 protein n=1 Tax=Coccomyxa viridis TaxID=1274662 RepID=A0ABP1FWP6_9CHLO
MNARTTNRALQPVLTPFRSGCAPRVAGRARPQHMPRRVSITPRADMKRGVEGIARAGDRIADSIAGILPASIPRGAAKIGILSVGGLIAFSVLQKIFSTFFFLAIIGGAAFLWAKLSSGGGGGGGGGGGSGGSSGDDPLSSARRIMDKYKRLLGQQA